nr:GNAT family N-acetyltransferase [Anaerolineae bacterium]
MPSIDVRVVPNEERPDIQYWLVAYSLGASPPMPDREERIDLLRQRQGVTCVSLFEDGKAVSTAASTAMTQNVRGGLFAAGGVWGVATHPGARRKGYSKQVMRHLLAAAHDQGQVFSTLYPFRESFYQRLGYVAFPMLRMAKFSPAGLLPLISQEIEGQVELYSITEAYDTYRNYLEAMRMSTHGLGLFDYPDKESAIRRNGVWVALAKANGEVEGLMLYSLKGDMPTMFTFNAQRLYYRTSRGRYLLLSWIARHIDQAETVEILVSPTEQPETWWPDLRINVERWFFPPMGRVMDVAGLGGMEAGTGQVVLGIADLLCPWNEGIWQLAVEDGVLTVSHSSLTPDAVVTIQGLTALVYGTHDPADFRFRGWGDPSPAAQVAMRNLFPPMIPHLHEVF